MGFEFEEETKETTKAINVRVPLSLCADYESEATARNTTVSNLIVQAMRFAIREAQRHRRQTAKPAAHRES